MRAPTCSVPAETYADPGCDLARRLLPHSRAIRWLNEISVCETRAPSLCATKLGLLSLGRQNCTHAPLPARTDKLGAWHCSAALQECESLRD